MSSPGPISANAMSKPLSRVDGRLKVTGAAKYPAEFAPPNMAHAFLVMSTISKGTITKIDSAAAEKAPGILAVVTHLNAPKLAEPQNAQRTEGIRIEQRIPLADDKISYGGQYVAMVVAETLEQARHGAALLKISHTQEKPVLEKERAIKRDKPKEHFDEELQAKKGDPATALQNPDLVKIEQIYSTPTQTHNPMECSATIAVWDAPERLTIYDATQYVKGATGNHGARVWIKGGKRSCDLSLRRRRIWLQGPDLAAHHFGGDGSKGGKPAGESGANASSNV